MPVLIRTKDEAEQWLEAPPEESPAAAEAGARRWDCAAARGEEGGLACHVGLVLHRAAKIHERTAQLL